MDDEQRQFRNALGCFATGVTVVTAPVEHGDPVGMTVSSFNSVSLDPPLVLFSIARTAHSLGALENAGAYAVNVLASDQADLSNRFARAGELKWAGVPHHRGWGDAPILEGALASFECEPFAVYEGGDHLVFLGRVMRHQSDPDGSPLVYFRGGYGAIAAG